MLREDEESWQLAVGSWQLKRIVGSGQGREVLSAEC